MLETAAKTIKNPVPIVASNIVYGDGADSKELKQAMTDYPSSPTKIIQKGSIKIGLLGLMGEAAKTDSPRRGTVDFTDIKSAAENAVADLKAQGANVIVALSHTGTDDTDRTSKNSEDYQLAKAVSGINFIISGHTHSEIDTPLEVNGTYIGSAKCFGEFLGEVDLKLDSGKVTLDDYSLLPSNSSVVQDPDMNNFIEELIDKVQKEFLDKYGFKFNQILAVADQTLPRQNADKDFTDPRLGKFIDDAYMYEVQKQVYNKKGADGIYRDKDGNEMPTIALSANGAIRSPLYKGNISLQDAFNVVGLGESSDEKTGYPLAVFYLKGSDLFTVAEIDASIADMMPIARLFYSGLRYYQSDARVPLNRVVDVEVQDSKGQWNSVDKNKLYPVVCNSYLADMVSIVPKKTFGLLNLVPRDSKGDELTDPQAGVLKTASGEEIPEWEAMASYLMSFPAQGISRDGKIGKVPESAFAQHVQEIDEAWSPGVMFKNLNKVSLVAGIAALLVIIIIVLLVLLVRRIVKRVRRGKNGGGSAGVSGESNPQGVLT
jgi:2',3'-cyclic-nucleotide 2'-phosphodiesterase (5'-nucleotidase family)